MKKNKQLIQSIWHILFITGCIVIIFIIGVIEYQGKIHQQNITREISNGQLNSKQLHQNGILILCYHRISNSNTWTNKFALDLSNNEQIHEYSTSKKVLAYQIKYLKQHKVKIISLPYAIHLIKNRQKLDHKYVVLTFDDVDKTLTTNVYPLLKKMGNIPYTVFIVTSNTGRYDNGTILATWPELAKVLHDSNVTIGVHTNNMHYLVDNKPVLMYKSNYSEFIKDYHQSEKIIKKHIGHTTPYFAYPYGEGTQAEQNYLAAHGMITFSLDTSIVTSNQDLSQPLPRTMVDKHSWKNIVKKWVNTNAKN